MREHVHFPSKVLHSLIPPFFGLKYSRIYVDPFGPLLATVSLIILLHFGHFAKDSSRAAGATPTEVLLIYALTVPPLTHALNFCAKSTVTFFELLALLGYSLYGHVFTILASYVLADERSNAVFFVCMAVFGGGATLRLAVLLQNGIALPAARLIVCSFVAMVQLLFLVFVHFAYMHPTFKYGTGGIGTGTGIDSFVDASAVSSSKETFNERF